MVLLENGTVPRRAIQSCLEETPRSRRGGLCRSCMNCFRFAGTRLLKSFAPGFMTLANDRRLSGSRASSRKKQRKALLPDLVSLACEPSYAPTIINARKVIMSLPKQWVPRPNGSVHRYASLKSDDDWESRRLLELCSLLDRDLTLKIAAIAAAHQDPEIREAGTDFLNNPEPFRFISALRASAQRAGGGCPRRRFYVWVFLFAFSLREFVTQF